MILRSILQRILQPKICLLMFRQSGSAEIIRNQHQWSQLPETQSGWFTGGYLKLHSKPPPAACRSPSLVTTDRVIMVSPFLCFENLTRAPLICRTQPRTVLSRESGKHSLEASSLQNIGEVRMNLRRKWEWCWDANNLIWSTPLPSQWNSYTFFCPYLTFKEQ